MELSYNEIIRLGYECKKQNCQEKIDKRINAIQEINRKQTSNEEKAKIFELNFQLKHMNLDPEKREQVSQELKHINEKNKQKRLQLIEENQDVLNALHCELDHCHDLILQRINNDFKRNEESCTNERCKPIINEMRTILEKAKESKLTPKLYRQFENESQKMLDIVIEEAKKKENEAKQEEKKNNTNVKVNANANANAKGNAKGNVKGNVANSRVIEDEYYEMKQKLVTAGLMHQECREDFKKAMFFDEDLKKLNDEYDARKKGANNSNTFYSLFVETEEKKLELNQQKKYIKCLLEKESFSDMFIQMMQTSIAYLVSLKNGYEAHEMNSNPVSKLISQQRELVENYKHSLPIEEKIKIYKAYKISEAKTVHMTDRLLDVKQKQRIQTQK